MSERKRSAEQGAHRERLTSDYRDIEVAIPEERYIVDEGKLQHILNEDLEQISGRYWDIELVEDNPETHGFGSSTLVEEALDDVEAFYTADYADDGQYLLADDGEELHEVANLDSLRVNGVDL
ncbi:MAG: hypothetical protein BRC26_03510 [Nanohaloarchaea archaeon QH_8_44_6]|nr:MAG: hypothetical protein BRC26_03510 [Nanohaloarchaea archaeon QH_8_44_6]